MDTFNPFANAWSDDGTNASSNTTLPSSIDGVDSSSSSLSFNKRTSSVHDSNSNIHSQQQQQISTQHGNDADDGWGDPVASTSSATFDNTAGSRWTASYNAPSSPIANNSTVAEVQLQDDIPIPSWHDPSTDESPIPSSHEEASSWPIDGDLITLYDFPLLRMHAESLPLRFCVTI